MTFFKAVVMIYYKMINLDNITNENNKQHNEKWPSIPYHPYKILIKKWDDIEKIYLYAKDLSEPKYEVSIKKHENVGTDHFNDTNAFIECSNRMNDVYQNIDEFLFDKTLLSAILLGQWTNDSFPK